MHSLYASHVNVSVIIPAYNAAKTISETLESLLVQTHHNWEAIVVDDGSRDKTTAIATSFAEKDQRIRPVTQSQRGVCAARNAGIAIARYDWLLFLDADDWIAPPYLERMTSILVSEPSLDAVYCGSARVSPDGSLFEEFLLPSGDMFNALARYAAFPIHACVVRRSLVESVGGFDASLRACEDWDLWQRIARTGARFGVIREVLVFYRMQHASASANALHMFRDGLRVLKQGHAPDARVRNPHPDYTNGLPIEQFPSQLFYFLCWCAGLIIGCNNDARVLLDDLTEYRYPELDPHGVAQNIYRASLLPMCQTPSDWVAFWPKVEHRIHEFLFALEEQAKASGLACRARKALERRILEHASTSRPLSIGVTHAIRVEVTETIPDIFLSPKIERLHCTVVFDGSVVGTIELPVCDGLVPCHVLYDAIAAEFAWTILGRFFERTIYPNLRVKRERTGFSIWRGTLRLTEALYDDEHVIRQKMHEQIGWTVFLQEIWGLPGWSQVRFYQTGWKVALKEIGWRFFLQESWSHYFTGKATERKRSDNEWLTIEVCDDLPSIEVSRREFTAVLTVGGIELGIVTTAVKKNVISAQELRVILTKACGFELCRAAVRNGLFGRPATEKPISLRDRLSAAKSPIAQHHGDDLPLKTCTGFVFTPESTRTLNRVLSPRNHSIILGRHVHGGIGTSASRRAALPATTVPDLIDAASVTGEPVIQIPVPDQQFRRAIYVPELVWRPSRNMQASFSESAEPERFQAKQTIDPLPANVIKREFELACAERHFTLQAPPTADATQVSQRSSPRRYKGNKHPCVTDQLPILMYHRVAPTGTPSTVRYRVTPDLFEEQIRYLHDNGYYSVCLKDWHTAMENKIPRPGKALMLTFDDGYLDFLTYAWPVLRRYGFLATVFLVADHVGRSNSWDSVYGEEVPLLGWEEIRQLRDMGVEFGSHSASHPYLTALSPERIVREGTRSRAILARQLGLTVNAFAYPYGDVDSVVQHLIGACGYIFGFSTRRGLSNLHDPLLALPRIEITGSDKLQDFIEKLSTRTTQVAS